MGDEVWAKGKCGLMRLDQRLSMRIKLNSHQLENPKEGLKDF